MTTTRPDAPLPAPLPYATQAGRDEVPAPKPRLAPNPGGPILHEDEKSLYLTLAIVAAFIVLMVLVAASGGL